MRRPKIFSALALGTVAVLTAPLRSDGGPACDNVTTSLQSTINNPIAGDEKFFTLPIGPSNVMFLLDTSGSMNNLPQCGDANTWGDSAALSTCKWPSWNTLSNPTAWSASEEGTCDVASNPNLSWMTGYTPTATLVDAGHGTASNGLKDLPPWGKNCTGNACLFQYDDGASPTPHTRFYADQSWNETSATPSANPCEFTLPSYQDYNCDGSNNAILVTRPATTVTLPICSACLTNTAGKGFFFSRGWRYAYQIRTKSGNKCGSLSTIYYPATVTTTPTAYFTGGWLNANPPKFMSARKVIKDVAWIDPNLSATTDQLRLGLSYLSTNITNGASIIVPLGPSAANSYPVNSSEFVKARQLMLDALNHTHDGAAGWPSGITPPPLADGGTPMATALFRIGQYFTTDGVYKNAFGSTYQLAAFKENVAGVMQAPWVTTSSTSFCWSCQKSAIIIVTDGSPNSEMTWPSGLKSYGDNVYRAAGNCGTNQTTSCNSPASACCSPSDSASNPPSMVPRIALWLHTPEKDLVPSALNNTQSVAVSAVSFNLPANNARTILQATANMGGGLYNNAADGDGLAAGVAQAVNQISNTSTSFGAPAATALTTINAVDTKAFITRFRPNQKSTWEGHLYEWMLFDENAAGCDPTKQADEDKSTVECGGKQVRTNFDGDATKEGYNLCTKSFLVDADCDEVYEDPSTGGWYKRGQTGSDGKALSAAYFWDAGAALSDPRYDPKPNSTSNDGTIGAPYRTAAEHEDAGNIAPASKYALPGKNYIPRNLWTALPDGTMLELETKNAGKLAGYMNLDKSWCSQMESLGHMCGSSPLPSCPVTVGTDWQTYCAQQVILFARGWDVMDQDGDGCGGPGFGNAPPTGYAPNPGNTSGTNTNRVGKTATTSTWRNCAISSSGTIQYTGEERDRPNDAADVDPNPAPTFFKLGDIFHSAPVLVHPPTSEIMCRLGMDNQCVRTIFGATSNPEYVGTYQTDLETYQGCKSGSAKVDAYRRWRADYANRENVVLVGSNDGFLHAFDAGASITTETKVNQPDVDCVYPMVSDGDGSEIWGFLPTDLLPSLRDTILNHQYMVDGNVMVRDVWVDNAAADGSSNNPVSGSGNKLDGVKQQNEFRTIAIFGERSGGMVFTALDVTASFGTVPANRPRPTLRWSFPKPRSDDAQYMAQSWSDSSPRPPPIGPVRLAPDTGDVDPHSNKFVEKWVVMLNGGYDPTLNRGRAVWMLDAWTGSVYWRFTDSDFKKKVLGNQGNTVTSMFPVTAGVAMVDLGDPNHGISLDSDNFFDTATWGDLGGNLWVARFDQPGVRGSDGVVTNWKAARAFEQGRNTNDSQGAQNRSEFFYMTSNAWEPQKHTLRTMVGSGNREQILEQGQGCGPDNLMSCCQAGCSVTTGTSMNYGTCSSIGSFACSTAGVMTSSPAFSQGCGTSGSATCTGGSLNQFMSTSTYSLTCGSTTSTATGSITCDANGLCTVNSVGTGHDVTPPNAGTCNNPAKFYGIWTYGGNMTGTKVAQKVFSTAAADASDWSTALTFDKNRFTDVKSYKTAGICAYTTDGTCSLIETTPAKVTAKGVLSCLDSSTRCSATVTDPGWFYTYNSAWCPTAATCSTGCTNEKTASGSAVVNSCTTWNSLQPKGSASSGNDPCQGAKTAQQLAIGYSSNYVSGVPDLACNQALDQSDVNTAFRGSQRTTIAPPAAPMARNSVTRGGKVYYSTLQLDPGSAASTTGSGSRDVAMPLYWTEVPREDHMCRHVSAANCE